MTITVINRNKKRKALDVDASDTVELVKARIEDQEGIPVRLLSLKFGGDVMEDSKALADYGVREGDSVRLVCGDIQIFVKTLTEKTMSFSIKRSCTIKRIKDAIFKSENILVDVQRLIFKGKQLEDENTASDYDIMDGDTIYLCLRLRG